MLRLLVTLLPTLRSALRSLRDLVVENLALRQQLDTLARLHVSVEGRGVEEAQSLRSQYATSRAWGGTRTRLLVFTERGAITTQKAHSQLAI